MPGRVLALLIVVEVSALLLLAADLFWGISPTGDRALWGTAAGIAAAAAAHTELSLRVERLRRRIAETRHVDTSSVWTFAAALALPPLLAVATVVAIYGHLFLRVFRPAGTPLYRQVYSTSTVVVAVYAVAAVRALFGSGTDYGSVPGVVALACSLTVYTVLNILLVVAAIRLSRPGSRFWAIVAGGESALELATLCLGGLVAAVILPLSWLLLILLLPLLVLLEQTTLIRVLEKQASTDTKTGLLNAAAWRERARELLETCLGRRTTAGVLILDLDHFKEVNDQHGHLAGDAVLEEMAGLLTAEMRDGDVVGRFGGEEFVAAVSTMKTDQGGGVAAVHELGERIRQRVEAMSVEVASPREPTVITELSVSVGAAVSPGAGMGVDALLAAADEALYAAKRAGRNRVRVRTTPVSSTPPPGADQ
ncbi:GGDEF domain-containing protein [Pseudonocardia kongjuensis]|uniref:GGDEF domain-containing protein n=1 Tax=Pseudonocardia kongjuensis TaxID=102227 RepID=A0ABN1XUU7_9PSEU